MITLVLASCFRHYSHQGLVRLLQRCGPVTKMTLQSFKPILSDSSGSESRTKTPSSAVIAKQSAVRTKQSAVRTNQSVVKMNQSASKTNHSSAVTSNSAAVTSRSSAVTISTASTTETSHCVARDGLDGHNFKQSVQFVLNAKEKLNLRSALLEFNRTT